MQKVAADLRNFTLWFLIVLVLFLTSCVPNKAYRWGSGNPPAVVPAGTGSDSDASKYDLAYLEFDDMGEFWTIGDLRNFNDHPHASELSEVLDLIKQRRLKGNLIVITFIHGWHNNASAYDEKQSHDKSLAGFKALLQTRANNDPAHTYIGIFMAWRGQALADDLFLTYWNRRDAAMRVSGPSLSETVFRLMFTTKGTTYQPTPSGNCQVSDVEQSKAQFIIIGHSFGSRILEGAVAQPFLTMLLERESQMRNCMEETKQKGISVSSGGAFRSPADMIVLLNSANDAFKAKAMIEAMKRMHLRVIRPPRDGQENSAEKAQLSSPTAIDSYGPLILSITSRGDWATGRVMPVAQTISGLGERFRSYQNDETENGQLTSRSQRFYFLHNEGNVPEFRTHSVKPTKTPDCPQPNWPYFKGDDGCYLVEPLHGWNETPFWVMSVSTHIIPNHTDVFKQNLVALLESVLAHYSGPSNETHLSAE
jgi:hypothetical protein